MACEVTDDDGTPILRTQFFERIIFLCTVLGNDRDLSKVVEKASQGVFNYWSTSDLTLTNFGFKGSAGLTGFSHKVPGLRQLAHQDDYASAPYLTLHR